MNNTKARELVKAVGTALAGTTLADDCTLTFASELRLKTILESLPKDSTYTYSVTGRLDRLIVTIDGEQYEANKVTPSGVLLPLVEKRVIVGRRVKEAKLNYIRIC